MDVSKIDLFGETIYIKDEYARNMLSRAGGNITHLNQIGRFFCSNIRTNNNTPYLFQGGCITNDNHAIVAARCATDGLVDLYKVNLATGETMKHSYSQSMGHANAIAFNPDQSVFVVSDTEVSKKFHIINYPSMEYARSVDNKEDATWIWYNRDEHCYYCGQSSFVCKLDSDFNTIKKTTVTKPIIATGQTGMVVDGIYYHLNYDPAIILMYDFETGDFIKCQFIGNLISQMYNIGEPEWIDYADGKFFCGCNENGTDTARNPVMHRITYFDSGTNITDNRNGYYMGTDAKVLYISGDFIFNPDGTQDKPFYTIREASLLAASCFHTGVEMIATKEYTEAYDIILKGSCYFAINTVAAHPTIYFNGNIELGRGTVLRMKNAIFNNHCTFVASSGGNIFIDTKNDHVFPSGVDMTLEAGTTITGTTKVINDIFINSTNTHSFQGCAVNCTNTKYPITSYLVDNCPTFKQANFTKNFPIMAGIVNNSNNSFSCKLFPEKFYMKWGNETFTIIRNQNTSAAGVECTGTNLTGTTLQIKQISMQVSGSGISNIKLRLYTSFSDYTNDGTNVLIVY